MPNKTPKQRMFSVLLASFLIGLGVLAGGLTAVKCHHDDASWFGPVVTGVIVGPLTALTGLVLIGGLFRNISTILYLRHTQKKMWRVLPAWMFLATFGSLMFGGFFLLCIGLLVKSRIVVESRDPPVL